MPGVVIRTGATSGPAAPGRSPASTFFVIGQAERGPTTDPVRIGSMSEFARVFGSSTTYSTLYDSLRLFFEEGGSRAYVLRIVGDAATVGSLSTPLQDRATTPAPTLSVSAVSAGAWSSRVSVSVLDGSVPGSFRLQVLFDGVVVEDFANLRSPEEAVTVINTSQRSSAYIRLTNAGSTAVAPDNNPAVTANPLGLGAGSDDRASIVTADYVAGLDKFVEGLGDGAVSIPGLGAAVHEALVEHANTYNRLAILSSERVADKATLLAQAAAVDAPRAGLFAPWLKVPDGSGGSKVVSPEGYIAAVRARAHDQTGPWRAAAGEISKGRWVISPDVAFNAQDLIDLDNGKVNAIVTVAGAVRNYGYRSLSDDVTNWRFLSAADLINRVVIQAKALLEPYVFAPIDDRGHLLSAIAATLEGIVRPIADVGGLFAFIEEDASGQSSERDPGYKVVVDASLNPRAGLANNEVFAQLGLRPAPTAALVYLDVTKASVTAAL